MEKLKSRKFWAGALSGLALFVSAVFDVQIDPQFIDALTLIAVTSFGGIAIEDTAKALRK